MATAKQQFDVYVVDGKRLRFLCAIEAKDLTIAERLVLKRVPAEHRDKMLVKTRGT